FPQTQILENGKTSHLLRYFGGDYLTGLPTRDNIVAENDEGLSAILNNALTRREDIPFMAVNFEAQLASLGKKKECLGKMISSIKEK
ncbi:6812_t:CDS:2, partial [Dentiscutata heterogama]